LQKTPEGPVVYDSDLCMGCRYCMMSCPFDIPRYLWSASVPYVRKCILCYDKIKSGNLEQPACTKACPTKATIFGDRDELLSIAHDRIAKNPGKYISKVYGETEVGGTSVLYISDIELDFLGWEKDLGEKPLPQNTWVHLKKVPYVFGGVGVLMGGIWWIIERRIKLQDSNQANSSNNNSLIEPQSNDEKSKKRES
jgi:formate dehydrogenase iron-sulfur subunit